jgi:hypothetical protein
MQGEALNVVIPTAAIVIAIGIPTLAVFLGILINNSRMTDLRHYIDARFTHVDERFTGLDNLFTGRLRRVEEVLDARLSRIEDQLNIR